MCRSLELGTREQFRTTFVPIIRQNRRAIQKFRGVSPYATKSMQQ